MYTISDSFSEHSILEEEPLSYEDALHNPHSNDWQATINSEFQSLIKNNTWEILSLPPNCTLVGCKWIFEIKYGPNNTILKRKARLVAQGFSQQEGVDYYETFSPILKSSSMRVLLAFVAYHGLDIHQMDVITAFLNGFLQEEVYMTLPKGLDIPNKQHLVCKLKKSLYGLKQSSHTWYNRLNSFLLSINFIQTDANSNIYICHQKHRFIILVIYVDETLLITNDPHGLLTKTKQALCFEVEMTDIGPITNTTILGLQVLYNKQTRILKIFQIRYIELLLIKFKMEACNLVSTPMEPRLKLTKDNSPQNDEDLAAMTNIPYKSLVGSLMHASISTRPNISYSTNSVAQYLSNPRKKHWGSAKRILRYLEGTKTLGLMYRASQQPFTLEGYSDANWAGNVDTRRSTSGYCFLLGNCVVSWTSRKQKSVALSSTESEYMAISKASADAIWLRWLLHSLHCPQSTPTIIYSDNQSAIKLTENPLFHDQSKHIEIQVHFVREQVVAGEVQMLYCPTSDMAADILTKSLPKSKHYHCVHLLGLDN
jgi:hypothetical protein